MVLLQPLAFQIQSMMLRLQEQPLSHEGLDDLLALLLAPLALGGGHDGRLSAVAAMLTVRWWMRMVGPSRNRNRNEHDQNRTEIEKRATGLNTCP